MMWIFFWLLVFGSSEEGARVVMGRQTSQFLVQSPNPTFSFPNYRNNGYKQIVNHHDGQIEVRVFNTQLSSKIRGRKPGALPKQLRDLEQQLIQASYGKLADQISLVVQWIRREINGNGPNWEPQDVASVLGQKSANCVGLANLTLFILEKMGVRARYVTGIAFKEEDPSYLVLEGQVLHRWIEIYYDDVGWVFCDPAGKVNFVEATYLVMGVQNLHPISDLMDRAVATRVELVHFENELKTIGALPNLDGGIKIRPNRIFLDP